MVKPMIQYQITLHSAEAHLFQVKLRVAEPDPGGQKFYLPAWIRGSYMIRDFSRHIVAMSAESNGVAVALSKIDKQTWLSAPCQAPLELTYVVYAWDLSVRGAHLDITHAYFNGPCVFLGVAGREQDLCEVRIVAPTGERYAGWQVATGMSADEINARGFGSYTATDYEELLDYPFEIGEFKSSVFMV